MQKICHKMAPPKKINAGKWHTPERDHFFAVERKKWTTIPSAPQARRNEALHQSARMKCNLHNVKPFRSTANIHVEACVRRNVGSTIRRELLAQKSCAALHSKQRQRTRDGKRTCWQTCRANFENTRRVRRPENRTTEAACLLS